VSEGLTHSDLVEIARKWLLGKGYAVVLTEIATIGEEPDALGFNSRCSALVECKASRADFLRDKKKPYRRHPESGIGSFRWYMSPHGLIHPEEIPEDWGLVWVKDGKARIKKNVPHVTQEKSYRHECDILLSVLRRIGQNPPPGISIRCYTIQNKRTATASFINDDESDDS